MSDHTQAIPRVGGAETGAQSQVSQPRTGHAPKSSSPSTSAIPSNGRAPSAAPSQGPSGTNGVGGNSGSRRTPAGQAPASASAPYRIPAYGAPAGPTPTATTTAPPVSSAPSTDRPWSPPETIDSSTTGIAGGAPSRSAAGSTNRNRRPNQRVARGPRKARLQLRHVDTWSALKISLVLSIVMFFVWMVAVGILYGVLSGLDVFDEINKLWGQLGSEEEGGTTELITPGLVFGGAALIGAINIVLFTALATISTYIYNLSADLVGGLEVTLSERE